MSKLTDNIPMFDHKERDIEQIIREGHAAHALRTNVAFDAAIRELYWEYTRLEDNVTGANSEDAERHRQHYSLLRLTLADLVNQLDSKIQEKENEE